MKSHLLGKLLLIGGLVGALGWAVLAPFLHAGPVVAQSGGWSEPLNVSNTQGASILMSATVDQDNRIHIVWTELLSDGEEREEAIYYTTRDDTGWSQAVEIDRSPRSGRAMLPIIAADRMNTLHLVWTDTYRLYYSTAQAGAAASKDAWSFPRIVDGVGRPYFSDMTVDVWGNVHIIWEETPDPSFIRERDVYYRRISAGGSSWTLPVNVSNTDGSSRRPVVLVDEAGTIYVIWGELEAGKRDDMGDLEDDVYYSWSSDGGISWSAPENLSQSPTASGVPDAVLDREGSVHLVWMDDYDVLYQQRWDGTSWSAPDEIARVNGPGFPSIALTDAGQSLVAWSIGRGAPTQVDIYLTYSGGESTRVSNTSGASQRPEVLVTGSNEAVVIWYDDTPGPSDIFVSQMDMSPGPSASEPQIPALDPFEDDFTNLWTLPINLSGTAGDAKYPAIASDMAGNIHVVWGGAASGGSAIYYKMWDGSSWSPSIDVLVSPTGRSHLPTIAVDRSGWIHVTWTDVTNGVYYSRAHVTDEPWRAGAWSQPLVLSLGYAYWSDLAVGPDGEVQAVWDADDEAGYRNIFHAISADSGASWSLPVNVSQSATISTRPCVAVDYEGNVHIAWSESVEQEGNPVGVWYRRLTRGGTWSEPEELFAESGWFPEIAVDREDVLHIVWVNRIDSAEPNLYYAQSTDHGMHWTTPMQVAGMVQVGHQPDMAVDSANNLHLVIKTGEEIFYAPRDDHGWSLPVPLSSFDIWEIKAWDAVRPDRPKLAISRGNVLQAVWSWRPRDATYYQVYRTETLLDAPAVDPTPIPKPVPTAVPTPSHPTAPAVTSSATPTVLFSDSPTAAAMSDQSFPVVVAIAAVAALIGVVVLVRLRWGDVF